MLNGKLEDLDSFQVFKLGMIKCFKTFTSSSVQNC